MLFLLALLILGIVWVASALIDNDAASMESLYGTFLFLKTSVSFVVVNLLMNEECTDQHLLSNVF